jgi:hypothetical protein
VAAWGMWLKIDRIVSTYNGFIAFFVSVVACACDEKNEERQPYNATIVLATEKFGKRNSQIKPTKGVCSCRKHFDLYRM